MDLSLIPDFALKGKQNQQQAMSHAMQQSLHILELPVIELADYVNQEVQDNFLLEFNDEPPPSTEYDPGRRQQDEKVRAYQESLILEKTSLFQHLMTQARTLCLDENDLKVAEWIIGNLNEKGFYMQPLTTKNEKRILEMIQTFEPPGIGARTLRESLLLQLKAKGKKESLATTLLSDHYDALKKNNLITLLRKVSCSSAELKEAIKTIGSLNLHPASSFHEEYNPAITVDLILDHDGEKWRIEINDDRIPSFRFARHALSHITSGTAEEKKILRPYLAKGKWLFRALHKREHSLKRIAKLLIKKNESYLLGESRTVASLTMQDVAKELELHESTITRAVSEKYLLCPAGILPLRSFFTRGKKNAKILLKQLIQKENKDKPLSDEALALKLKSQGLDVARRTVAKYRKQLRIAPSSKRRPLI